MGNTACVQIKSTLCLNLLLQLNIHHLSNPNLSILPNIMSLQSILALAPPIEADALKVQVTKVPRDHG